MNQIITSGMMFYLGWAILPIIVEFIPSVGNFIMLLIKKIKIDKRNSEYDSAFMPPVSIIIPVYNSSATLYECIRSVAESNYDISMMDVFCVDNGSKDNSFDVFQHCQMDFPDLAMNWMHSAQGKSKALNKAIFNCEGKYIINIDSDGQLERNAIRNMVRKFEQTGDIDCMTGAVLTDPELIKETPKRQRFLRFFQNVEFMEYCQAFLAGRNFQSETNTIFTVSGAFSAFRKSTLLKTRLYNTETICEDAHLTFQIKEDLDQRVSLCEDAIFMVDPIESVNKYYTQRQRWQIGELEVAKMYVFPKMKNPLNMFFNADVRLLLVDHTFSFPKFIWFFVMALLCLSSSTAGMILSALALVYGLSVVSSFLYFTNVVVYLRDFPIIRSEYVKRAIYILVLPLYTLFSYFVRLCGILNSINRKSSWKTKTFTEETNEIKDVIKKDLSFVGVINSFVRAVCERSE